MENRNYKRWTAEEDSMLRRGATKLPGRTDKSVYQRRRTLGLVKSSHWNKDEITLAQQGIVPAGRTKAAFRCLRNKLGITNKTYLSYIRGGSIPSTVLVKLSEMTGKSTDYLLGLAES